SAIRLWARHRRQPPARAAGRGAGGAVRPLGAPQTVRRPKGPAALSAAAVPGGRRAHVLRDDESAGSPEEAMKYFTRQRYIAMQDSDDEAVRRSDEDWEAAVDRYDAYLRSIRPQLPEAVRPLVDGFYLHDASVLSVGQRGDRFVITLRLDVPPNEVLTIVYHLAGPPQMRKERFPRGAEEGAPIWLYEELDLVGEGAGAHYVHRIL